MNLQSQLFKLAIIIGFLHLNSCLADSNVCEGIGDTAERSFVNLDVALSGYNLPQGNPFSDSIDPGWRAPIFAATSCDTKTKKWVKPNEVDIDSTPFFETKADEEWINSQKEYEEKMMESTNSAPNGNAIQDNLKVDFTEAGLDQSVVEAELKQPEYLGMINNYFQIPSSASADTKKNVKNFFELEKGSMFTLEALAVMHTVILPSVPKFDIDFKEALLELSTIPQKLRETYIKQFVQTFGTHYSRKTVMGGKMVYFKRFSQNQRRNLDENEAKDCAYHKAPKIIVPIGKDTKHCSQKDSEKTEFQSNTVHSSSVHTVGSLPKEDADEWMEQNITPSPLKMHFAPIPNLFTKKNLKQNLGNDFDAKTFLNWFIPMYIKLCEIFGWKCKLGDEKQCEVTDNCNFEQICVEENIHPNLETRCAERCHKMHWPSWDNIACVYPVKNCSRDVRERMRVKQYKHDQIGKLRKSKQRHFHGYDNDAHECIPPDIENGKEEKFCSVGCCHMLQIVETDTKCCNYGCYPEPIAYLLCNLVVFFKP